MVSGDEKQIMQTLEQVGMTLTYYLDGLFLCSWEDDCGTRSSVVDVMHVLD